jgi:hypothetical protein
MESKYLQILDGDKHRLCTVYDQKMTNRLNILSSLFFKEKLSIELENEYVMWWTTPHKIKGFAILLRRRGF